VSWDIAGEEGRNGWIEGRGNVERRGGRDISELHFVSGSERDSLLVAIELNAL